jgi:hypothetical protein
MRFFVWIADQTSNNSVFGSSVPIEFDSIPDLELLSEGENL